MIEIIREKIKKIIEENGISDGEVLITTKTLTPQEAIGNPEHSDYPLLKGRERLMEADFISSKGVAFSDMFGNFQSTLFEILNMELKNNFRRAIFIATTNAILRKLDLIEKTMHCKNEGLTKCASEVCKYIKKNFYNPKIFLCGLQPRFAEKLSSEFEVKITDLDRENNGKEFNGVKVESEEKTEEYANWCDLIFATGSTYVNDTAKDLIKTGKKIVFYGVTGAGPCFLLGFNRYCFLGR